MPGQNLNLLSLDGGGIRGLSSLYILKRLMEAVNPDQPPKPCDYFDMIAGTSTGGLIAIMLGRLKMDVQQCIDAYRELSDQAFKRKRHIPFSIGGRICERFDSKELEMAIKKVLVKQGYSEDTLLKELGAFCRVFVCATSEGTSTIVPLRSYPSERGSSELYNTAKIWEAGRATSAASTFFDSITIGPSKQRFFDGATGANNPVRQLWKEAKDVWSSEPFENNIGCIISIGTGVPSMKRFGKDGLEIFRTLKRIATETEATARDFHQEHTDLDDTNRYFRFNVPDGLAEYRLEDVSESSTIVDATQYYLANELVHKQVKICAKALGEREVCKVITLTQTLTPNDPSRFLALLQMQEWDLALEGSPSSNIFERLSDYEPDRTYRNYLRNRCEGTTSWILHDEQFIAWLENKSHPCLWLSGKIGCGKTIITTTVVQHLIQASQETGNLVAHFFYSHSNKSRLEATHLFESYIKQILGYLHMIGNPCPSRIISYLKQFYGYKRYPPSFDEIIDEIFLPLSALLPSTTYIVDGLDECEIEEVRKVLKVFRKIGSQGSPRVFISGREGIDVTNSMPGSITIRISNENHKKDISMFIDRRIEEKIRERQITEDKSLLEDIKSKLNEKADRMILWASLQLDALWDDCFTDADIQKALANLPKDLSETYARCLTKKFVQQSRFAPKILRWVCAAIKPFKIDQLREALAIDPSTGCLCRDEMPPTQEVLKCCSNLITRDNDDQVLLAHHSVRQFLKNQPADAQLFPSVLLKAAELELGELCVTHITSSDYSLALQTPNLSKDLTIKLDSTAVAKITGPIQSWMGPFFPKPRPVQISIPVKAPKAPPVTELPSFFHFAKEQWAFLTHEIDRNSDFWPKFRTLALEPNLSWRLHPWEPMGESLQSHYCGLLGWATANQHLPLLEALLTLREVEADAEIFNLPLYHYGNLPVLHLASRTEDIRIVNLLLTLCNPKKIDNRRRTALHYAAEAGCSTIARRLIEGKVSTEAEDENGDTALDIAALNGHNNVVSVFFSPHVSLGASVKRRETIMSKALRLAAMNGHHDTVKLLANVGANVNAQDGSGWTALHRAASNGHRATVQVLIERDADVNTQDGGGWTALHRAASNGHKATVQALIERGADVNKNANIEAKNSTRRTIPSLASLNGFRTGKLDVKLRYTPLCSAAEKGHWEVFQRLLKAGANRDFTTLEGHSSTVWAVKFSPDGKLIASGSHDETVGLCDTAAGALGMLKGHLESVRTVAFSPDGKLIASGSDDYTVILWDVATRSVQTTLKGHSDYVRSVAFSPDGKLIASGSDDCTVILWDVATRSVQTTFKSHSRSVFAVAFSPDGKLIASGSNDCTVILWDVATRSVQTTLKGYSAPVWAIAFSPDGKLIASGSYDCTVILWDVATRSVRTTLKSHSRSVSAVAFSPDGKLIASGSTDGTITLWLVGPID